MQGQGKLFVMACPAVSSRIKASHFLRYAPEDLPYAKKSKSFRLSKFEKTSYFCQDISMRPRDCMGFLKSA